MMEKNRRTSARGRSPTEEISSTKTKADYSFSCLEQRNPGLVRHNWKVSFSYSPGGHSSLQKLSHRDLNKKQTIVSEIQGE